MVGRPPARSPATLPASPSLSLPLPPSQTKKPIYAFAAWVADTGPFRVPEVGSGGGVVLWRRCFVAELFAAGGRSPSLPATVLPARPPARPPDRPTARPPANLIVVLAIYIVCI